MTITVISADPRIGNTRLEAGESWHVDDNEHLHVRDADKKHIGTFARGSWASATIETGE